MCQANAVSVGYAVYKQELIGELEDFLALIAALEYSQFINLTSSQQQITKKLNALL